MDIRKLARAARLHIYSGETVEGYEIRPATTAGLMRFADLVRAEVLEEAAKACEAQVRFKEEAGYNDMGQGYIDGGIVKNRVGDYVRCTDVLAAIRALKSKP